MHDIYHCVELCAYEVGFVVRLSFFCLFVLHLAGKMVKSVSVLTVLNKGCRAESFGNAHAGFVVIVAWIRGAGLLFVCAGF